MREGGENWARRPGSPALYTTDFFQQSVFHERPMQVVARPPSLPGGGPGALAVVRQPFLASGKGATRRCSVG